MPLLGSRGAASLTGFGALANLGYFLRNSLRFRGSNNAYLSRTPASAGTGTGKTWTWSGWVKRGTIGSSDLISLMYGATSGGASDRGGFGFYTYSGGGTGSDSLTLYYNANFANNLTTTQVFRDPSAWYHIIYAVDTTQATASNRVKLYVNGVQVTAFSASNYPTQNYQFAIGNNVAQWISSEAGTQRFFDGYLAELNFIDGQALTPSSFGKTDPVTGQWVPKKFGGAYGTNGFYLKFDDSSAVGKDSSGNGNNWSTSGHSVTPGATYDLMTDVPTLTNATTANYCVINTTTTQPTGWQVASAFSNGGLTSTIASAASDGPAYGTIALPRSGKWYWEVIITNSTVPGAVGISESSMARPDSTGPICRMLYSGGGTGASFAYNGFTNAGSYTFFGNATLGIACDMDNGAIYFAVNGTYVNSGVPTSGASKTGAIFTDLLSASPGGGSWLPMSFGYNGHVHNHNYGQRPFAYSAPSGYKTLNTFNLP